jgi:hypothetical protein
VAWGKALAGCCCGAEIFITLLIVQPPEVLGGAMTDGKGAQSEY